MTDDDTILARALARDFPEEAGRRPDFDVVPENLRPGCRPHVADEGVVCAIHGAAWHGDRCLTRTVLDDFAEHRWFQFRTYGANRHLEDGTGPDVQWLAPVVDAASRDDASDFGAARIEALFREEWDYDRDPEQPYTWLDMLREELAEVAGEARPRDLEVELIQLGALCASWVEKLRERRIWQYARREHDGTYTISPGWDRETAVPAGVMSTVARRRIGGGWEEVR